MNIKSLLLGSAAVLIAASTAQAADAIVVEPEPVDYVRICDTYGNGFFYIPGTETCMRIGGYIRSTYEHYTQTTGTTESPNHGSWTVRGRLNVDVRNETDWGTLRSQLRLQGGDASAAGDQNVGLDRVLISVAGFRLGYSDTYWTTAHGYGQNSAVVDGLYNYDQGIFFDYTYANDGFSVTGGVQDSTGTAADAEAPDYYIGTKFTGSWGWFAATYIYDQTAVNNLNATVGGDAYKISLEFTNIGDSGWNIGGWYMADGEDATQYVTGGFLNAAGVEGGLVESQWGVQINGNLADNLNAYVTYSAADAVGSSTTYLDTHGVTVGLVWKPITGLSIQTEYYSYESDYVLAASDFDQDGFIVRITRSW